MYKKYFLLVTVFLTGALGLVIEILGVRILSPFFGNTMFTVSSVISVFLAALSVGYYIGGILADKKATLKILYTIILLSGISVYILHILTILLLPIIGYILPITSGPFISSLMLFFLPGILIGMVSPYTITLQKKLLTKKGIGSISGEIFFWSTFGSIFGSLLTGFVLIPLFGIDTIILGTGTALIILGIIPLFILKTRPEIFTTTVSIVLFLLISEYALSMHPLVKNILYQHDGLYEKITVISDTLKGERVRILYLDRSQSGASYVNSNDLVFEYANYHKLYKVLHSKINQALIIGGGAYNLPQALLNDNQTINVDVTEIEPSLYTLSKQYLNIKNDKRLTNYVEDGRRFLHDNKKKYDYIFSDVYYSLFTIPAHFTTEEFFKLAYGKLEQDGIFIANIIGNLSPEKPSLIFSEMRTFLRVFPNSYFFATESPKSLENQNIIFIGIKNNRNIDWNTTEITNHNEKFFRDLSAKLIDQKKIDLSDYPILTDNYAPIDYFTSKLLVQDSR